MGPARRAGRERLALLKAFQAPGVPVIDDVQHIAAPELAYLP
ncbi:hypothetical protein AADR41_21595 [Streptomyces sp. CLV115]